MDKVFEKLSRGLELYPQERVDFLRFMRELEHAKLVVEKIEKTGFGIELPTVSIGQIRPQTNLLYPFSVSKAYHLSDTQIPDDGSWHTVTFNQNTYGNNDSFELASDNQKVFIRTNARQFWLSIPYAFAANATGARDIRVQYYDVANTLLGSFPIHITNGFTGADNWHSPSRIADLPDTSDYIKVVAKQTSGGNLALLYLALDLHIV